jgi:hypothetical protein
VALLPGAGFAKREPAHPGQKTAVPSGLKSRGLFGYQDIEIRKQKSGGRQETKGNHDLLIRERNTIVQLVPTIPHK